MIKKGNDDLSLTFSFKHRSNLHFLCRTFNYCFRNTLEPEPIKCLTAYVENLSIKDINRRYEPMSQCMCALIEMYFLCQQTRNVSAFIKSDKWTPKFSHIKGKFLL